MAPHLKNGSNHDVGSCSEAHGALEQKENLLARTLRPVIMWSLPLRFFLQRLRLPWCGTVCNRRWEIVVDYARDRCLPQKSDASASETLCQLHLLKLLLF
mmetsp:Transcript_61771/g.122237  ORF Transcript_61771/g.122237 Transcript_61771/m.122237 type:complete len:100 (+) Transcript_61771:11-310(+)